MWWRLLVVVGMAVSLAACGGGPPPAPPQPIAFSHQAHSENDIGCTRCHAGAEEHDQAGLAPVSTCAACHRRVIPDHPEIVKLMDHYENQKPILWRKVNHLPETAMVHFEHKPHARAGVECAACHGEVSRMTVARGVIDTSNMGWCLDCHRQMGASDDCLTCHH